MIPSSSRVRRLAVALVACFAVAILWTGCSDDSSPTGGGGGGGGGTADSTNVGGSVHKGGIDASSVNLFNFTASGGMGSLYAGPFTTDAAGNWTARIPTGSWTQLLVVASGGTYTDEATGNTVNAGSNLYGILFKTTKKGNATPMTHAIIPNVQQRIVNGATLSKAITDAVGALETAFGYDVTATAPSNLVTRAAARSGGVVTPDAYGVFLAGISALLDGAAALSPAFDNADVWDLVIGIAMDLTDGVLDGFDVMGNGIFVDPDGPGGSGAIPWPALDGSGIDVLVSAANAWAVLNSLGITLPPIDLTDFGDVGGGGGGPLTATVSGTLSVSGTDSGTYGSSFSPNQVIIAGSEGASARSGGPIIGGFAFNNNETQFLTLTLNPLDLAPSLVQAQRLATFWIYLGFPITGVVVTETSGGWSVVFTNLQVSTVIRGSDATGSLVFNGTLQVTLDQ